MPEVNIPEVKIKVYATNWCPDSLRAKQCLTKCRADFEWIDIDQDKDACAYVEKVNNGSRSVPTIVFPDGCILVEPSNSELEAKVAGR